MTRGGTYPEYWVVREWRVCVCLRGGVHGGGRKKEVG